MPMADISNKCEPAGTLVILNRPSPRGQAYRTVSPLLLRISFIFAAESSSPVLKHHCGSLSHNSSLLSYLNARPQAAYLAT